MPKVIIAVLACLFLPACSMTPAERSWQMLHAIDVAQTMNGPASDPCYRETAWVTSDLIGSQPSRESVLAWGVGLSVVHYYVSKWLDQRDWPDSVKLTLRSFDLGYKGMTVANNHAEGVRPFGDNVSCY